MTNAIPRGRFSLRPGLKLIPGEAGGVLLQPTPLRLLRVNSAAFALLQRCHSGFFLENNASRPAGQPERSRFAFLDALWQSGFLNWQPAPDTCVLAVSIVLPVYNRAGEIGSCLEALLALNYPGARREIIVVDDGSTDGTPDVVRNCPVRLLVQPQNLGPSAARNAGVRAAGGDIIAFIDSDCIADPDWLRELLPYFQDSRVALVGGYVDSFFRETRLDRFEEVQSPLNLGQGLAFGTAAESDFYVPTCNVLIRKDAYLEVGGLDEGLRLGEDVDLCWRLKERGHRLLYVPRGKVRHKHRNRLREILARRFDYGTSEAFLFSRHEQVKKRFPWKPMALGVFSLGCLALLTGFWLLLPLAALLTATEAWRRQRQVQLKAGTALGYLAVLRAILRDYFGAAFYLTYHLLRYYLLPIIIIALIFPAAAPLAAVLILFPATVEFARKKPRLSLPLFLCLYLAEQACYQAGVFWGCLIWKNFRPYHLLFFRSQKNSGAERGTPNYNFEETLCRNS
ncbi:MAG: mycofactocin biosynthesis glycosyltransferase MftF [Desulfobaccales bacterium]